MLHRHDDQHDGHAVGYTDVLCSEPYVDSLTSTLASDREEQVCGLEKEQGTCNEGRRAREIQTREKRQPNEVDFNLYTQWLLRGFRRKVMIWLYCAQLLSLTVIPWTVSLPGSSVLGIFQAGILEWAAISSFRGSSWSTSHTLPGGFLILVPNYMIIIWKKYANEESVKKKKKQLRRPWTSPMTHRINTISWHTRPSIVCVVGIETFHSPFSKTVSLNPSVCLSIDLQDLTYWFLL